MKTEDIKSLKELTPEQMKKCDKIIKLLIELKKENVHPFVLDGGGGSGLQFIRCSKTDMSDVGEIFTDNYHEAQTLEDEYVYSPSKYYTVTIPTWVP